MVCRQAREISLRCVVSRNSRSMSASSFRSIISGEDGVDVDTSERTRRASVSKRSSISNTPPARNNALARLSSASAKPPVPSPAKPVTTAVSKPPLKAQRKSLVKQNIEDLRNAAKLPTAQEPMASVQAEPAEGSWLAQQALAAREVLAAEADEKKSLREQRRSLAKFRESRRSLVAEVLNGASEPPSLIQQPSLDAALGGEDADGGEPPADEPPADENADPEPLMPTRTSAVAILGSGEDWLEDEGAYGSIDVLVERQMRSRAKSMSAAARANVPRASGASALARLGHGVVQTVRVSKALQPSVGLSTPALKAQRKSLVQQNLEDLRYAAKLPTADDCEPVRAADAAAAAAQEMAPSSTAEEPPEGSWLATEARRSMRAEKRKAAAEKRPPAAPLALPPDVSEDGTSLMSTIAGALSSVVQAVQRPMQCVSVRSKAG